MKADKSDDLHDIPSFSVSREDIRSQTPVKSSAKPSSKKSGADTGTGTGSKVMPLLSLLLFIALLGVAYFGYQQSEILKAELASNQQAFELTLQRLQDVNGKVAATGVSMSESGSKVQAELKVINSEIRKLWDVANKRNRRDIADNESKLGAVSKSMSKQFAAIDKKLASAEKKVAAGAVQATKASKQVDQLKSQVQMSDTEQAVQLEAVIENIDSLQAGLLALTAQMELQNKQQREDLDGVLSSATNNREAVTSIDAFRRQVNSQLLELRQAINRLQGG